MCASSSAARRQSSPTLNVAVIGSMETPAARATLGRGSRRRTSAGVLAAASSVDRKGSSEDVGLRRARARARARGAGRSVRSCFLRCKHSTALLRCPTRRPPHGQLPRPGPMSCHHRPPTDASTRWRETHRTRLATSTCHRHLPWMMRMTSRAEQTRRGPWWRTRKGRTITRRTTNCRRRSRPYLPTWRRTSAPPPPTMGWMSRRPLTCRQRWRSCRTWSTTA
mmetsp:Transcript_65294/g.181103  ORF Transcript_65294/g.181103 Transcript_65294/m.181103 type:complete len:223 (+) Transcript_65294:310-978(+)